jgi:DNA-binding MarR family transcriptional regulator
MTNPPGLSRLRRYMRHGTLPQLAAFEAVVRFGSATRAADALCIAQPTISGHLRKLSEALGVRLFDLRGKRLVPTAAGLAVLQTAHEVFAALERCEDALAGVRAPAGGPLATGQLEGDHGPQLVRQDGLDEEMKVVLERFRFMPAHAASGDDDRRQVGAEAAAQ